MNRTSLRFCHPHRRHILPIIVLVFARSSISFHLSAVTPRRIRMIMTSVVDSTLDVKDEDIRNNPRRLRKRIKKHEALLRRAARLNGEASSSSTVFVGSHKWLGGAVDPATGDIYGVPSHSHAIIRIAPPSALTLTPSMSSEIIDQASISTLPLPYEYRMGRFKWLRGIIRNGFLYGIPCWSTGGVLRMTLATGDIDILPIATAKDQSDDTQCFEGDEADDDDDDDENGSNRWQWHGGAVAESSSSSSAIYCPPSNANRVLKIQLDNGEVAEEIGPDLSQYGGQNRWYGGITGLDGCVYAPPYAATGVLRIDPRTDKVDVIGDFPEGGYKWHGGLLSKTGMIYAFPCHANEVLCIDTNIRSKAETTREDESWRISTTPIHRHDGDTDESACKPKKYWGQYKWLGGSYGADGCLYGMPSDSTSILRIDPITNKATTFGTVPDCINKWQGGVLSNVDNCFYAVPANMDCVLRVNTDLSSSSYLQIDYVGKGNLTDVDDKFQGGFVGRDGRIYAIPESSERVMVITPGESPSIALL